MFFSFLIGSRVFPCLSPGSNYIFAKSLIIAGLCAIITIIKVVVDGGQQQLPIQ